MSQGRKCFKRENEEDRKLALIQAAQTCIVEGGIQWATVRNIAAQAGVTPGLIRHYFPSKDALLCEAYRHTMWEMTAHSVVGLEDLEGGATVRLHQFIKAVLSPPVMSARQHQLWASFTSLMRSIPDFAQVHQESYLEFRRECRQLVRDVLIEQQRVCKEREIEQLAVALNAQLDGLWLEGCLASELFDADELVQIGIRSIDALLVIAPESE
ncbi:TetR/AcrR family transcriptional regulator [Granulosicoccus antarcticus]|uniref:HTH-type transcriptional regulator BetI n=1 Tax=Granulosicoccus antarcticus IMCC3135 TaxID=1192854 RepID=A0A2Z2P2J6_9GAMM|nr:TetR family transcriptional regulator C-terminal domain-containing protein [Granulosicoccus antarcticus]ASJ74787.1 HTH-type transcriptional regulator BetI [Granulosicoccus antarcticus IMCC3135]